MKMPLRFFLLLGSLITSGAQVPVVPESDWLVTGIDSSVSPRDDFFTYVNGGAFKRGVQAATAIVAANNEVRLREKTLAEKAAAANPARTHEADLIGSFWFTGMNVEARNSQGIEALMPDLRRIDAIASTRDLMDVIGMLNLKSRPDSVLFRGWVWRDEKDSSRWVYHLSQGGGRTMENPSFYTADNANAERVRKAFLTYISKTLERLSVDKESVGKRAEAIFDLEAQLTKAETANQYQRIRLGELEQLSPGVGWERYLKRIGIKNTEALVITNADYFRALSSLLRTVPLTVWKDFVRFRLMRINGGYVDERAFADFFEFDRNFTGAQRPGELSQRVTTHMGRRLGQPMARLFLAEYNADRDRARFSGVAEVLRAAFRARIEKADWLGTATKQKAIEKLDRMRMTIGFPDKLSSFSTMQLKRDSYVLNVIRANEWLNREEIRKVGKPVDRTEVFLGWGLRGDAGYDATNNELFLPATYFPSVSGQPEIEDAALYGSIGVMLAHEMSHGFDSRGRNFDATGTTSDWWTSADAANFNIRTKALIELYNGFSPAEGVRLNGTRTLAENMSDLGGVLISLDAFKRTEQFKQGVSVNGFTPLQRFFLAFARRQSPQPPQLIIGMAQFGEHSPDRERVNGVLMNIPEFYEAFNIKPGDRMYLPEGKQAKIW